MRILPLMKEKPVSAPDDLHAEEVVERAKILQSELCTKAVGELSKKSISACRQDDVVNIEEQVGCVDALSIDKERRIGARGAEAKLMKERGDALVPSTGRLLQSIQGLREQAH